MTHIISKICITYTAIASGEGYQIKKYTKTNDTTKKEYNKCLRKNFSRIKIFAIGLKKFRQKKTHLIDAFFIKKLITALSWNVFMISSRS